MKRVIYICIFLMTLSSTILHAQKQFELKVDKNVNNMVIKNLQGDIVIERGSAQTIRVTVTLYKDSEYFGESDIPKSIEMTEKGSRVQLKGISDDSNRKYQIVIPEHWPLKLDIEDNQDELTIHNNTKPLEVITYGCDINLIDNSAPISISTKHGDVFISWTDGMVKSDSYITTVAGEINMEFEKKSAFGFQIRPYRGTVENTIDMYLRKVGSSATSKIFEGKYNNGESTIYIETTVGDIILSTRK